jgi:hypothetical protein
MKSWIRPVAPALIVAATLGVAFAKLPATAPLDPAKAEQNKARDAAAAAVTAAQQAKAEDRSVAHYLNEQKAKGRAPTPQMPPNGAEMDAKAKDAQAKAAAAAGAVPGATPPVAAAPIPASHAHAPTTGRVKVTRAKAEAPKK